MSYQSNEDNEDILRCLWARIWS